MPSSPVKLAEKICMVALDDDDEKDSQKDGDDDLNDESYRNWLIKCLTLNQLDPSLDHSTSNCTFLGYIIGGLKNELSKINVTEKENGEEKIEGELTYVALNYAMTLGALSFFCHEVNHLSEATGYLNRVHKFLANCLKDGHIPRDMEASFEHLLTPLMKMVNGGKVGDNFKIRWSSSLSSNAKIRAGIYGIKQHFFHQFRNIDLTLQADILRKAISLNPGYYEWHLSLHKILRCIRRKGQFHHYQKEEGPSKEEIEAIELANKLRPKHPWCMVGGLLMLADHAKNQYQRQKKMEDNDEQWSWQPVQFLDKNFDDLTKLVWFIQEASEDICKMVPDSVHCNCTIAMIFTKLLNPKHDCGLSQKCLKQCLKVHRFAWLANHGMAEVRLKKGQFKKAKSYFEKALKGSMSFGGSFAAWTCLIQILLGDPHKNEKRLMEIFKNFEKQKLNMVNKHQTTCRLWKDHEFRNILYFNGLLLLGTSKVAAAVKIFSKLCEEDENALKFDDLQYQAKKFGWGSQTSLTAPKVRCQISKSFNETAFLGKSIEIHQNDHNNDDHVEVSSTEKLILKNLDLAIQKNEDYNTKKRNRDVKKSRKMAV